MKFAKFETSSGTEILPVFILDSSYLESLCKSEFEKRLKCSPLIHAQFSFYLKSLMSILMSHNTPLVCALMFRKVSLPCPSFVTSVC